MPSFEEYQVWKNAQLQLWQILAALEAERAALLQVHRLPRRRLVARYTHVPAGRLSNSSYLSALNSYQRPE